MRSDDSVEPKHSVHHHNLSKKKEQWAMWHAEGFIGERGKVNELK